VFSIFVSVAQAAAPVGLLSLVTGNVQIVRAGEKTPRPARTADLIGAGDRVLTGSQSEATFLFRPESRSAKILAGAEVQFEADSVRVQKGKLGEERKLPSCHLPENLALAPASRLEAGIMRLRGSNLILLSPSRTNIATPRPLFLWEPVESATGYSLKLLDREERVLWSQNVASTEAQYPVDAPPLAWDQKYWWRVTAHDAEDTLTEVGAYFQVLPEDQAERVRSSEASLRRMMSEHPADNGALFLLAFLHDENGMPDQAARAYGALVERMGPQEWVQARLSELMNKLGWQKLPSEPAR